MRYSHERLTEIAAACDLLGSLDLRNSSHVGYLVRVAKDRGILKNATPTSMAGKWDTGTEADRAKFLEAVGVVKKAPALVSKKFEELPADVSRALLDHNGGKLVDLEQSNSSLDQHLARPTTFLGMPVRVEVEVGETKSGVDDQGISWSHAYEHPYGEVSMTEGADGDAVDYYLGPTESQDLKVYVVHQLRRDGSYDEDKVMLGFQDAEAAEQVYRDHGPDFGFGSMDEMTLDEFKKGYLASNRLEGYLQNASEQDIKDTWSRLSYDERDAILEKAGLPLHLHQGWALIPEFEKSKIRLMFNSSELSNPSPRSSESQADYDHRFRARDDQDRREGWSSPANSAENAGERMPCDYVRTGKLKEHLAHYRQCSNPACRARLAAWEDLKKTAAEPGAISIDNSELSNPSPRSSESQSDYVSRFMGSAEALRDYPDHKQRAAVAYSMYRERKNMADFKNDDHDGFVKGDQVFISKKTVDANCPGCKKGGLFAWRGRQVKAVEEDEYPIGNPGWWVKCMENSNARIPEDCANNACNHSATSHRDGTGACSSCSCRKFIFSNSLSNSADPTGKKCDECGKPIPEGKGRIGYDGGKSFHDSCYARLHGIPGAEDMDNATDPTGKKCDKCGASEFTKEYPYLCPKCGHDNKDTVLPPNENANGRPDSKLYREALQVVLDAGNSDGKRAVEAMDPQDLSPEDIAKLQIIIRSGDPVNSNSFGTCPRCAEKYAERRQFRDVDSFDRKSSEHILEDGKPLCEAKNSSGICPECCGEMLEAPDAALPEMTCQACGLKLQGDHAAGLENSGPWCECGHDESGHQFEVDETFAPCNTCSCAAFKLANPQPVKLKLNSVCPACAHDQSRHSEFGCDEQGCGCVEGEFRRREERKNSEPGYDVEWEWNGNWRTDDASSPLTLAEAEAEAKKIDAERTPGSKMGRVRVVEYASRKPVRVLGNSTLKNDLMVSLADEFKKEFSEHPEFPSKQVWEIVRDHHRGKADEEAVDDVLGVRANAAWGANLDTDGTYSACKREHVKTSRGICYGCYEKALVAPKQNATDAEELQKQWEKSSLTDRREWLKEIDEDGHGYAHGSWGTLPKAVRGSLIGRAGLFLSNALSKCVSCGKAGNWVESGPGMLCPDYAAKSNATDFDLTKITQWLEKNYTTPEASGELGKRALAAGFSEPVVRAALRKYGIPADQLGNSALDDPKFRPTPYSKVPQSHNDPEVARRDARAERRNEQGLIGNLCHKCKKKVVPSDGDYCADCEADIRAEMERRKGPILRDSVSLPGDREAIGNSRYRSKENSGDRCCECNEEIPEEDENEQELCRKCRSRRS